MYSRSSEDAFVLLWIIEVLRDLLFVWSYFIYSLIYYIPTAVFPLSPPSLTLHTPLFSPLPSEKSRPFPGTLAKYGITSYNKTRHIFSKQSWMRQPSRNKRVPKEAKESETAQLPLYVCMRTTQVRAIQGPWCLWVHLRLSHVCESTWGSLSWFCGSQLLRCPWSLWLLQSSPSSG